MTATLEYGLERMKVLCDQMRETLAAMRPHVKRLPEWKRHRLAHVAQEIGSFREAMYPIDMPAAKEDGDGHE